MNAPIRSRFVLPALLLALGLGAPGARGQFGAERHALSPAERQALGEGRDRLRAGLEALGEQSRETGVPRGEQLPDAEIYLEALDRNLRQELFFSPQNVEQARACLREGEARAAALKEGRAPWERQAGVVVRGHRSRVDGTAQPYQLYVPPGYDFAAPQPGRLDLFLHGRAGTMNEIAFLAGNRWLRQGYGDAEPAHLVLYPYGRANNGWRFAGERDAFEALAEARRRYRVDPNRIVLRGFSMGGHGAWHMGLQHPGRWAAANPGAGFVETRQYRKIAAALPPWEEKLLHLYDALDYAANGANLPVLAYAGDQDPVISQHRLMGAAFRTEGVPLREFTGVDTGHRYEPRTLAEMLAALAEARRQPDAAEVRFVTYTLRWPECKWVRLEGLERHWERAEVRARLGDGAVEVSTRNISALRLTPRGAPATVRIDGQQLPAGGRAIQLVKREGTWSLGRPAGLRKRPGLQGPIDDALFGPVLAVRGTGRPWSPSLERWAGQELARFRDGWGTYFRGTLPERADRELTEAEARENHLYLFGDPGSNAVLARLLPELPLQWTPAGFELAGRRFSAADHLPVLVFPNPEIPGRYVVLNSGFTFSRADWQGSNALQYPRLPDYAVVRFAADLFADDRRQDTVLAGFFDEWWRAGGG